MSSNPTKQFSREEVAAKFNGQNGQPSYIIVNGDVLDVTRFAAGHPGGEVALLNEAGKDATKRFYALHRHEVLEKRIQRLKVGEVQGYDQKQSPPAWKSISKVPYAEIDMENSPYWNASHVKFRQVVREYLWDSGLYEYAEQCEVSGEYISPEAYEKLGKCGMLALCAGLSTLKHVPEPNLWSMAGIKPENMDVFHLAIACMERTRMMCPGAEDGFVSGISIGFGPVSYFGQEWTKGELVQNLLMGKKRICLAITEPEAGSDVAGIRTVARQATVNGEEGFIVSGTKKWITNSVWADYLTTLVKTVSKDGKDLGYSMLLVEKNDDVVVRSIPTNYSLAAGTGLVSYENVFVPNRNLLGKIGQGFEITMHNFNMERWGIIAMCVGRSQRVIEESFLWAMTREAFGKKLIEQPVIRYKLGDMIADHQAVVAQFEKLTHQYNTLSKKDQNIRLGGPTGLLKYRATRMTCNVSDGSVQIFGGRGVTKTGMGKSIERNMKSFKLASVYGGSEEICVDLGVRQAMKIFPKHAKL
ncbi:hypothetical protein BASA81_007846 [Batrachochytrium salamandrivorans]|nr:hypothetical protein BASA81_007846 [Batrachochytrium salamandrivorans]